ncbi:MAG: ABC transporter permease [Christensenellales bacterium]
MQTRGNDKLKRLNRNSLAYDAKVNWQLYLMLLLPILYIIIFAYVPMGGAVVAFKDYRIKKGILQSPWVGLQHFRNFFNTPDFGLLLSNTIILSLYSLVVSFPFPILLALTINECSSRAYRKTVQMITYAPYFISTVVLVGMMSNFFSLRTGFVNSVAKLLNAEQINYMGVSSMFRSMYVWSGVWQSAGYGAVIYIAALGSVDYSLVEAAQIDGANRIQRVIHIDIPTILPTIVIQLILAIGGIMGIGFEKVYLMQNPVNLDVSEIIATFVYKRGLAKFQYSYASAVGLFNSVVNLILIVLANTFASKIGSTSLF